MTTLDVLALLVLAFGTVGFGLWFRHVDRVLRDPDHPNHEDAKAAIEASETRDTLSYWWEF